MVIQFTVGFWEAGQSTLQIAQENILEYKINCQICWPVKRRKKCLQSQENDEAYSLISYFVQLFSLGIRLGFLDGVNHLTR